jgi:hypothetical protein
MKMSKGSCKLDKYPIQDSLFMKQILCIFTLGVTSDLLVATAVQIDSLWT